MKFISFEQNSTIVPGLWLQGERVLDLPAALRTAVEIGLVPAPRDWSRFSSLHALIAAADETMPLVRILHDETSRGSLSGSILSPADIKLVAPIPRPAKNIFCVGRNYFDHVAEGYRARGMEVKAPEYPQFFTKPPTAVTGPDADIPFDPRIMQKLDYEVELAVVIGRTGRDISPEQALEHIFGYTIINDVTARDLQRRHDQWFKGKGLDSSCPMGPWIVSRDEIPNPQQIEISLSVNGEERQHANTSQMIFDLPRIISDLSQGMTLEAGDIIATGTPSGVGYAMDPPRFLAPGDVIECRVEGVGSLTNRVSQR